MNGFVQIDLPRTFDFYSDFTLSGWIYSCKLPNHAAAISLECAEVHEALLQIGEWDKNKILQVCHHSPNDPDGVEARFWLSSTRTYEFFRWYHVAVTRSFDSLTLYLDGVLQKREKIPLSQVPLSRVRLCSSLPSTRAIMAPLSRCDSASVAPLGSTSGRTNGMGRLRTLSFGHVSWTRCVRWFSNSPHR
jgi:hypothetical protein